MLQGTPSRASPRRDPRRRGRRSPASRSSSILGSLKSFISSPLAWFTSQENLQDFEDTPGKRRRHPQVVDRDDREHEEGDARAKRQRVRSPEPEPQRMQMQHQTVQPTSGYLDVPEGLVQQPGIQARQRPGHTRSSSLIIPPTRQPGRHDRHTLSPLAGPSYAQPVSMTRTMSMDPPAGYRPRAMSRDVSMGVASTRNITVSSSRTPFHLRPRASMTPQPSGQAFGPVPQRRECDMSEPPPLEILISNPVFVKPPLQAQAQGTMLSREPTLTLGTLAEAHPRVRRMSPFGDAAQRRPSLVQTSSLLMERKASVDSGHGRSINPAEKALQDLDVYKTPLLPTRLRGSPSIPDMFKPKKMPVPVLMTAEADAKPRLGMGDKKQRKEESAGAKPYAGQGGMKKLLARRRQEEEEEREKDKESAMDDEQDEGPSNQAEEKASSARDVPALPRISMPELPPAPAAGRPAFLRVGRCKTSRTHQASVARGKNRFSAYYEDEEADDSMPISDDMPQAGATKPPPSLFQPPAGFSFAKDTAPIRRDTGASKEPPIASLPFSLNKSNTDKVKSDRPAASSVPSVPKEIEEHPSVDPSGLAQTNQEQVSMIPTGAAGPVPTTPATAPATPMLQTMPSIALTPMTPDVAAKSTEAATSVSPQKTSAMPNFFANSTLLSKTPPAIVLPASGSLFGASATDATAPAVPTTRESDTKAASTEEGKAKSAFSFATPSPGTSAPAVGTATETFTSTFGDKAAPSGGVTSISGADSTASSGKPTAAAQSTNSGSANSVFAFGGSAKPAEPAAATTVAAATPSSQLFNFGAPPKAAEAAAAPSPFNFAPAKPAESSATLLGPPADIVKPTGPVTTPPPVPTTSAFIFGAPKSEPTKAPDVTAAPAPEPPKSLFGPSSTPFGGFGSGATGAGEAPKAPFAFGQPAATPALASSTPPVQAPKPLFGDTGSSSGFPFGAPAEPTARTKSPFPFGAAPATPPAASNEKPAFSFDAPQAPSTSTTGSMLLGGPTGGSHGTDVSSKPFVFGPPAPARPVTPPRNDQEISMDESPTRGAGMDLNGHGGAKEPLKVTTGFNFGSSAPTSATSPFGQSNQSASAASPFSFGTSSSVPSIFGGAKPESKQDSKPAAGFGFGQAGDSAFSFGPKPAEAGAPAPSTSAFGALTAATAVAPAFAFSASAPGTGGPFGQAASNPNPVSPSAFGSTAPFAFGATPTSATAPSNPFAFASSQPASPAASSSGLPSASASSPAGAPFQFGQPAQAAAGPAPAPAAGGAVFNIGAAAGSARPVKKLPTRRGGKR